MKPLTLLSIGLLGAILPVFYIIFTWNVKVKSSKPIIILPIEWQAISHDKNKPDLLVGHLQNDTLYIRFDM